MNFSANRFRSRRVGGKTLGVLLLGMLVQSGAWATVYMKDSFDSYASLGDATTKGPWVSSDTYGSGSHGITTLKDAAGADTKAYFMTTVANEDSSNLAFRFPGSVNGSNTTGVTHFFIQWKEKRSSNYDFGAEKSCRAYGRQSNGNVNLDVIMAFVSTNNLARDSVITNAGSVGVFGQGYANDSNYFFSPFSWDRTKWYTIEWEVKLNDVGASNGYTKLWINGTEIGRKENIAIREGSDNYTFQEIRIGGWESGGTPAVASTRYLDDVVISDQYVGVSGSTAPVVSPPNPPAGVSVDITN